MGAGPFLTAELDNLESVTLLPLFAQEPQVFLQSLHCFFYRTAPDFLEPSGRVVTEAMACGLPIVAHTHGGYAETIDHGRNGFLFDTQQEAFEILLRLKEDPALRASVGGAARETAEKIFGPARRAEIVEFYLR
jgi:glycosyltransferase involved in cell wall biosynthesis